MEDEEPVQDREQEGGAPRARLDKWLWAAQFFKARPLATQAVEGGRVKVNGERVKPTRELRVGDRVAVQMGEFEWEVDVLHLPAERGGILEGEDLYEETDDSRDRRALVIANRNSHAQPAWARAGGDAGRARRAPGPGPGGGGGGGGGGAGQRRSGGGGAGGARHRGATAAFLSPDTSPSQLVAAVTGQSNGGRPAAGPAHAQQDQQRKPRRRRRGRTARVRGTGPGGGGEGGGSGGHRQS